MSFNKKLFAVILAVSLTAAFCGQAFAAEYVNDPRYKSDGYTITYGEDDTVKVMRTDSLLVMVNGGLVGEEARLVRGVVYIPAIQVMEALGGVVTDMDTVLKISYGGMTVTLTDGSRVIQVGDNHYDVGAAVMRINSVFCFPLVYMNNPFLSIKIYEDGPLSLPVLTIDEPVTATEVYTNVRDFYVAAVDNYNKSAAEYLIRNQFSEWYLNSAGMIELSPAVDAFKTALNEMSTDGKFGRYYVYTGEGFDMMIDRYNLNTFIIGPDFVADIDTLDVISLMK